MRHRRIDRALAGIDLQKTLKALSVPPLRYDASGVPLEAVPGGGIAVGPAVPLAEAIRYGAPTPPELQGQTTLPLQIVSTKDPEAPIVSEEEAATIKKFFSDNPELKDSTVYDEDEHGKYVFNPKDPWIQTFTGRRFTPTNPNPDAIVIRDIAHALSLQCRFSGHVKSFYSVAQHCVLVSYICDRSDALWGLLHDATEAYLLDLAAPLKRSGKFDSFKEVEAKLTDAICKRFDLPLEEPPSVKKADIQLLVTEGRDLLTTVRSDWVVNEKPLPFKIAPWSPDEAEDRYMERFFDLKKHDNGYEHYLHYKYNK